MAFGLRWVLAGSVACVSVNSTSGFETSPGCEVTRIATAAPAATTQITPPSASQRQPAAHAREHAPRVRVATVRDASDALDALRADPCGARLLSAFAPGDGVHLVGGAVRDLLLERPWRELDVVVEGDVDAAAARLGGQVAAHERFGTARVTVGDCAFDLVRARAESYAHPGALPDVRPGTLEDDLRRRDVTVNAMALRLDGTLAAVEGAVEDLEAGLLRVLHDASFVDDPTRVWRVARYAARLGFAVEPRTRALAAAADPTTVERRPPRGRAAPGPRRARPARRAADGRASSTPLTCRTASTRARARWPARSTCCPPTAGATC